MTLPRWLSLFSRKKAVPGTLSSVPTRGGWFSLIAEPFAGAWQRNLSTSPDDVLAFSTVYACVSLIASDISKLGIHLVQRQGVDSDVWMPVDNSAYSPVLRKPNHYQNRIKFIEQWILSKLLRGNTYVLKARDETKVVRRLYVLDPQRVRPMVATDGSVYYGLASDHLSGLKDSDVVVPASEIIHDLMCPLYHPLVGVSPIHACGLAALQGLRIQAHAVEFFANKAQPGSLLTSPQPIDTEQAKDFEDRWQANFTGERAGRVAVLGGDWKYQALTITPEDAQLIEQLKWAAETVCSCFHVPAYMVGAAPPPPYNNIEALNQQYYSQCLQALIESLELCLDEGLGLANDLGVECDLEALLRMDTATKMETVGKGVEKAIYSPNEARARFNLKPVTGGDSPMLQQQNYSLEALAKRDAQADPFATKTTAPAPDPPTPPAPTRAIGPRLAEKMRAALALESAA